MANLIKSALIKQLSKYLKNVSANQINISTFKGEGEMKNIELDENVLMDLLELPTWLSITNARCNKANLKIQWTKLKTIPIIIALDKIEVDMEINENLREYTTNKDSKLFDKDSNGPYGFIDRCIDGIQLNIDSITVTIKSNKFNANLSMSNLLVYSTTPNWKVTSDIRNTRLKDLVKEEIIVFKEISWEICRLEAFNIEESNQSQQQQQQAPTSIKLIMNPSKIQIALKKKLSDKSLLNSTFRILLNEIYWMANDTQLKAAIGTYNTISKLIKKSALQKRKHMAYKQQQQQQPMKPQDNSKTPNASQQQTQTNIEISKVFQQYDIIETSLHLNISVLNVHLYADDNYSGNKLIDGGAMQVLFKDLFIDHYPYHKTGQSIKHWNNYNHIFRQREDWSKQLMEEFVVKLQTILNKSNLIDINRIKLKNEINLLESCIIITLKDLCVFKVSTNMSNKSAAFHKSKKFSNQSNSKLNETTDEQMSPNDLLKSNEYFVHQQMFNKRPFFSTNFSEFNLPSDTMFAHLFFSEFYFPDDCNYPVPCSQFFSHISPVLINIDYLTLLWINTLALSLWNEKLSVDKRKKLELITINNQEKKLNEDTQQQKQKKTRLNLHCDTHIELLMPKITISIYSDTTKKVNDIKRQTGIEIGFARITATNKTSILSDPNLISACSKVYDLSQKICHKNSKFSVFNNENKKSSLVRLNHLAPCLIDLVKNENIAYFRYDLSFDDDLTKLINTTNEASNSKAGLFLKSLNRSALNKNANKDLWCVNFESMWLDSFNSTDLTEKNQHSANKIYTQYQSNSNNNENIPLIQNISFKFWIVNVHDFYKPFENSDSNETTNEIVVNSYKNDNVNKAFDKLSKVIKIEDLKIQPPKKKRSNSLSAAGYLNKNQQNSYYLSQKVYSKLNVISEINELSFKCSHSQIIFLLRLLDTVDLFTQQLKIDSEHTLKYTKNIATNINEITKDKNNNTNRLSNEFEFNFSENNANEDKINDDDEDNFAATLNLSLLVNSVDLELYLNDMRKEINSDFIKTKKNNLTQELKQNTPEKTATSNQLINLNEAVNDSDSSFFDTSYLNITIKDPMKEDTVIQNEIADITKKLDQEFISGYLKYIYGFTTDNPNLRLSFSTLLFDDTASNLINNNNNDIVNLAKQVNKIPVNINSVVSVGFTAASSTLMSKKNSTISFFNKPPSFSQIKSNLKNQLNPQSLNSLNDLNDNDVLVDDNDSYSVIMSSEQDDTSSLASFSTEASFQINSNNNNNTPKEKRSPTEPTKLNFSVPNSSSSSSIKIASISSQVIINDFKNNKETSNEEQELLITSNPNAKQFQEFECQTVPTAISVKFKLNNINTFVQVNDNSDMFALVNLNQIQIRNLKNKFKIKSNDDYSLFDDVFKEDETSEIVIRFKKIEESSDCKDGLLEILLEDFSFEMDMPTLAGLIDFIDDDDIGVLIKEETLPFNINVKNCQFFLNDHINDTDEYFKNQKTVSLTISNLFVSKLANNEIKITELNNMDQQSGLSNFNNNKKRNKSLKEESLSLLDEIENDTNSIKPVQLASLVFQLRKSKEQNHHLQNELELEKSKNKELENSNSVFKNENQILLKKLKDMESNQEASNLASIPTNDQLELERKQFESLIQTYQDENEQLKNKLIKTDDLLALLNIERDCLIKKLNEQMKVTKK